uniref:Uncharacterized protein n=2 Tax=Arundo donax TaxID=35708 RepID=A0A0A9PWI8_ARUDO
MRSNRSSDSRTRPWLASARTMAFQDARSRSGIRSNTWRASSTAPHLP